MSTVTFNKSKRLTDDTPKLYKLEKAETIETLFINDKDDSETNITASQNLTDPFTMNQDTTSESSNIEEPSSKLKPKRRQLKGSKNKPKKPPNKEFDRMTCSKSSTAFVVQIV